MGGREEEREKTSSYRIVEEERDRAVQREMV